MHPYSERFFPYSLALEVLAAVSSLSSAGSWLHYFQFSGALTQNLFSLGYTCCSHRSPLFHITLSGDARWNYQ
jgi:hypothetical protein